MNGLNQRKRFSLPSTTIVVGPERITRTYAMIGGYFDPLFFGFSFHSSLVVDTVTVIDGSKQRNRYLAAKHAKCVIERSNKPVQSVFSC